MLEDELSNPEFDAESFVLERGGDARKLQQLRAQVQALSDSCTQNMKKNVFHNYTQFIETAREISHLESEMYQLSHLLTEQRSLISSLQDMPFSSLDKAAGAASSKQSWLRTTGPGDDKKRSMQQLLEKVEGAGRLTENPNRYVLFDSDLMELNSETLAAIKQVHLFLLNDSLLVTSGIPHKIGAMRYKYEDFYQVENIAPINIPDSSRLKDAFKLLIFPHQRIFQADGQKLKRRWLDGLENAKRVLLEEGSLVRQATLRTRMSIRRASMQSLGGDGAANVADLPPIEHRDSAASEHEAEWLRELPDELDVCIAQRDFEGAAELIFEGREHLDGCSDTALVDEVRSKLSERERQLCDVLCRELSTVHGGPKAARRAITLLTQMGMASQACELYLKNRSQALKQAMRELKILDVPISYVHELSNLVFSTLTDVVTECQKMFTDHPGCCAVLVVWASGELKHYVTHLVRHVFDAGPSPSVIGKCVEMVRQRARRLPELGLDLTFELEKLLEPHIARLIRTTGDNALEAGKLRLSEDAWRPYNAQSEANLAKFLAEFNEGDLNIVINKDTYVHDRCKIWLTGSTISFARTIVTLINDLNLLVGNEKPMEYTVIAEEVMLNCWRQTLNHFVKSQKTFGMNKQLFELNAQFLRDQLLPRTPARLADILRSECPALLASSSPSAAPTAQPRNKKQPMESIGDV